MAEDHIGQPADAASRAVVDEYVAAFRAADLDGLRRLLADSAILEMPPFRNWYAGREDYSRFIARVFAMRGTDWQFLRVGAGGQPAVAAYVRAPDGNYRLHSLQVLAVAGGRICRAVVFADQAVFDVFGLAASIKRPPAAGSPQVTGARQPTPGRP